MAGMVLTSTKRPPMSRAGTGTWRRPLMSTRVRDAPRPRRLTFGDVLGEGRRLVRVVPAVPLADDAVADVEVAEQVDELGGPLLLEHLAADHGDGVGHVDGRRVDGGPGHRHRHLLEEAAEGQVRVDHGGEPIGQLDVALEALEAGQRERDEVAAGGEPGDGVAAVAVGHHHPGGGQRGAGSLDRHAREDAPGVVGDGARDAAVLRRGGPRRCQHECRDQHCSHRLPPLGM